jgi:hypothetical protein
LHAAHQLRFRQKGLREIGKSLLQFGLGEPQLLAEQIGNIAEVIAVAADERTNPLNVGIRALWLVVPLLPSSACRSPIALTAS